jgi:uncharacterized protein YbjT (DUF2867 family)
MNFLKTAFNGAGAVYTMVPPNMNVTDWKAYIERVGNNYAAAIKSNGVKYVVNLSSIGAHLAEGAGPVSGLHRVENSFNDLKDVNIKHLRPGYFYPNLLSNIGLIKNLNIVGGNNGDASDKIVLVDPSDIAAVAAEHLDRLDFSGHTVSYIAGEVVSNGEVAKVLGEAVGKPDLPWVEFSDDQSLQGMLGAGLSEEIAKNYTEMGASFRAGKMTEDFWKHQPESLGKVKLKDFAKVFADIYNN